MDHELIAFGGREDHDLQEVAGAVRADEQPSVWFFSGVFGRERMVDSVEDVLLGDAVFVRRVVNLHAIIVLRICGRAIIAKSVAIYQEAELG